MSLTHIVLFIVLSSTLFSQELKTTYTISGLDFNASHISPSVKKDFTVYTFEESKHQKAFTSSKLILRLQEKGLALEDKSKGIVHVKRKSGLDFKSLREKIERYYQNYYPHMKISDISFKQGSYIEELSDDYELKFKKNAHMYSRSSLQIISRKNKKRHFINYELNALIKVFKASHNIKRGKILTPLDLKVQEEAFTRFKGIPLQGSLKSNFRLKKRLIDGKILYQNDIEKLPDVLKDKNVNVRLVSGLVHLEFQAISLEDGHIGDKITIKNKEGKRLKATVISPHLVEIQ